MIDPTSKDVPIQLTPYMMVLLPHGEDFVKVSIDRLIRDLTARWKAHNVTPVFRMMKRHSAQKSTPPTTILRIWIVGPFRESNGVGDYIQLGDMEGWGGKEYLYIQQRLETSHHYVRFAPFEPEVNEEKRFTLMLPLNAKEHGRLHRIGGGARDQLVQWGSGDRGIIWRSQYRDSGFFKVKGQSGKVAVSYAVNVKGHWPILAGTLERITRMQPRKITRQGVEYLEKPSSESRLSAIGGVRLFERAERFY